MSAPLHRGLAAFVLAGALGTSAFGAGFWLLRDVGAPPESFPVACERVRARHQPGDLIYLVPFYATRAKECLGDLAPLAVRDPLAEDLEVHRRAWVLSQYGEGASVRAALLGAGQRLLESERPAPGLELDLFALTSSRSVRYRFEEHLQEAKVFHEKDGQLVPCAAWSEQNGQGGPGGRYTCPYDSDWFYVSPEWHRMGETPRRCFWAHPPSQGRLVVRFPAVPLTGRLHGYAGHTLNGSRFGRAPVHLDIQVGELAPHRVTAEVRDTWRRFVLSVPQSGTATVTFSVSTADAGTNHFCFTADMRD